LKLWGHIAAGLGGGGIFLAFHLGLEAWPSFSVLAGVAGFVGLQLVLRADSLAGRVTTDELLPGSLAHELVMGAQAKLVRLDGLARAGDAVMAARLDRLIETAGALVERILQHPAEAMQARRPLTFYLDATLRIVEHYAAIRQRRGPGDPSLAKVWAILDGVEQAFTHHADKAVEAEITDLETELTVLERTLKAELK
jgi:hypothetical protein